MEDLFKSAKRRIGQAKTHIQNMEAGIKGFMDSTPYAVFTEPDPQDPENFTLLKVRQTEALPIEFSNMAVDAVDALRSALDQACYAAAVGAGAVEPKSAYFPFADSAAELETAIKGRCKDLPREVVELARAYRPYKGGTEALWAFNKARQSNQHKFMLDFSLIVIEREILALMLLSDGVIGIGPPTWDPVKHEMILAHIKIGTDFNFKPTFTVRVTFRDAGPLENFPAFPALQFLLDFVASAVERIEGMSLILAERDAALSNHSG
jgi:hypothetical protein